jgi:Lar family restriction alleviation protein
MMTDNTSRGEDPAPCPFCGGTQLFLGFGLGGRQKFMCAGCEATSPPAANRSEAIAAWNRRAPLPTPGGK